MDRNLPTSDAPVNPAALHVVTDTDRRGAQVFASDLVDALSARWSSARTVALARGGDPHGLPVPPLGASPRSIKTLWALRGAVRAADIVVAHGSTTLQACALTTAMSGVPFVYRSIGDPAYWARTPRQRVLMKRLLRRAAGVVALSSGAAQQLVAEYGLARQRIRVIPNAVPADRFPPVHPTRRRSARARFGLARASAVVLYLGELSSEKNVALAVHALAALDGPVLLIVGSGPERATLADLADRVVPGRVRFFERTAVPKEALAAADVLVLPSQTEGMPAVLIEAGMSAIPSVATDVGSVSEVVVHGETGLLVAPGDVTALSMALRTALDQGVRWGAAARIHCLQHFEMGAAADRWDNLLTELGTPARRHRSAQTPP